MIYLNIYIFLKKRNTFVIWFVGFSNRLHLHFFFPPPFNEFVCFNWYLNFWLRCVSVATHRSPLAVASRGYSLSVMWGLLIVVASYCRAQTLQRWLSSCGARAWLLLSMWDLSGPRITPVSLALTGVFFTTGPPGKSRAYISGENFPGWWQRSTWTWKITKQHNYLYTSG